MCFYGVHVSFFLYIEFNNLPLTYHTILVFDFGFVWIKLLIILTYMWSGFRHLNYEKVLEDYWVIFNVSTIALLITNVMFQRISIWLVILLFFIADCKDYYLLLFYPFLVTVITF